MLFVNGKDCAGSWRFFREATEGETYARSAKEFIDFLHCLQCYKDELSDVGTHGAFFMGEEEGRGGDSRAIVPSSHQKSHSERAKRVFAKETA